MATKRAKHLYIQAFGITVMVLALARCVFPEIAGKQEAKAQADTIQTATDSLQKATDSLQKATDALKKVAEAPVASVKPYKTEIRYKAEDERPHPIKSVHSYAEAFPDSNHVQLEAAQRWGVPPVKDRADAETRKNEVIYMGSSPYYTVAHLDASIPYLVPRASILLEDIGRNFFDSLQVKGLPLHWIVVSSVLRSEADVSRLRRSNKNATEQSCHLYGTTFDINYNQYAAVNPRREVPSDKLKYVLSEVLRDLREQGRCYIKYEVKQPCFHITVR